MTWWTKIWSLCTLCLCGFFLVGGCAPRAQLGAWEGSSQVPTYSIVKWDYTEPDARVIRTEHYLIHTTITREELIQDMVRTMEGALEQYRKLVPGVAISDRPMDCYIFVNRTQWNDFTRRTGGADAGVYLKVVRGGYTAQDRFVSYYIGDRSTFSVAAHEGWHQFVARHFAGRVPPFLEEGIACMFEHIRWVEDRPQWNLSIQPDRALALMRSIEQKRLWPLGKLMTMHAGEIVNLPYDRVEAFYAQNWAFARFLWEGEGGKYRPAIQKLLTDTAAGGNSPAGKGFVPQWVQPTIERYLGKPLAEIDAEYQQFIRKVAYDEMPMQWGY